VAAGTVFHKTRTDLSTWLVVAYKMSGDKRGVSAMHVSREFILRYDTAWPHVPKLRNALFEREGFGLADFVEADETFYGGYREKGANQCKQKLKKDMPDDEILPPRFTPSEHIWGYDWGYSKTSR
jgi:hypothetical protein